MVTVLFWAGAYLELFAMFLMALPDEPGWLPPTRAIVAGVGLMCIIAGIEAMGAS